ELAVAVEVAHGHGLRVRTDVDVGGGLEGAVAIAQQHAHVTGVGDRQVELAVFVEVADREGLRVGAAGGQGRLKRAVCVAQEYVHGAAVVDDGEVQPSVAVEVGRQHSFGRQPNAVADRGKKTGQAAIF